MKTDLISLLDNAKLNKKENDLYLRGLRNHKEEHIFTVIKKIHQEVFTRIDCIECANCCKTIPALVTNSDIKRIASVLNISAKQFLRKYVRPNDFGVSLFWLDKLTEAIKNEKIRQKNEL